MANIGNNIFDNLKQMRRPYVAPEMLVEEILEEFVLQENSGTISNTGSGEHEPEPEAKSNHFIFFSDDAEDWYEEEYEE